MDETHPGSNIILGVTGSIAAYKACSVLRGLLKRGHRVRVVMTESAQEFVTPTTFRSLSGRPVATGMFVHGAQVGLQHISLADWVEPEAEGGPGLLTVVPATANFIGKAAGGIADDILSCTWMACHCPKVVAPAMNDRMWLSLAVQRNVEQLQNWPDVEFVQPVEGELASGRRGVGHLAPVEDIIQRIHSVAVRNRA